MWLLFEVGVLLARFVSRKGELEANSESD
jgi:Sec-independent protein secretion pathway component TatC